MKDMQLLARICARARDPLTRTDFADRGVSAVPEVASVKAVQIAERALGFAMHPFLLLVLTKVGNGGFGPGDGILGIKGGHRDHRGRDMVAVSKRPWGPRDKFSLPPGVVALCDWGDATWSCLDVHNGRVLTLTADVMVDTRVTFEKWMGRWADGADVGKALFYRRKVVVRNIKTGADVEVMVGGKPRGVPYIPRG